VSHCVHWLEDDVGSLLPCLLLHLALSSSSSSGGLNFLSSSLPSVKLEEFIPSLIRNSIRFFVFVLTAFGCCCC